MPAKFELIAPCFFGCESTANFELRRIGAEDIRVSDGRLTFRGGADMIAAANLNLRTVERVMLLIMSSKLRLSLLAGALGCQTRGAASRAGPRPPWGRPP